MKDRNEYGFYSNGYVFDRLVRTAICNIRKTFPELEKKQINLVRSTTHFVRQFYDLKRIRCFTTDVRKEGEEYHVDIEIRNHSMLMAYGFFTFLVAKKEHYAITKEEITNEL